MGMGAAPTRSRSSVADIRAIFNAADKAEADALLKRTAQKYDQKCTAACCG